MNDPHGIVWDGNRYHMFFQYVPDSLKWESNLDWGHAVSDDLVTWRQVESALTPDNEVGCWSGSAISVKDGFLLFYTRPTLHDWSQGQVVVVKANSELTMFQRIEPPVITEAPDTSFFDFRDPQVRRDGDTYLMTIGAGMKDVGGCALQYRSLDAFEWKFDSVLASRSKDETSPIATGTVWECPQFFPLGTKWCLIISSIDPDSYQQVNYAIGTYDGRSFQAETWGNLGFSSIPYATTTFQDNQGNSCMMSWLKESSETTQYAGAQSIPIVMKEVDGRLEVDVHPNLHQHFADTSRHYVSRSSWIRLRLREGESDIVLTSGTDTIRIQVRGKRVEVSINQEIHAFDVPRASTRAEIFIDADILEVLLPETPMTMALRIPDHEKWDVTFMGDVDITLRNYLG